MGPPSLVTEKVTNNIDVFSVNSDGSLSQPTITPDPIPGVFDVVFSPDGAALILQTGGSVTTRASSISSYLAQEGGTLVPVTGSVPALGTFACWIALTPDGSSRLPPIPSVPRSPVSLSAARVL
jgi:6-phosphogluconolactonase